MAGRFDRASELGRRLRDLARDVSVARPRANRAIVRNPRQTVFPPTNRQIISPDIRTGQNVGITGGPAGIRLTPSELAGYSGGTTKVFAIQASDGKAVAGAGAVTIDEDGILLDANVVATPLRFRNTASGLAYIYPDTNGNLTVALNIIGATGGSFEPDVDGIHDLGSTLFRWQNVHTDKVTFSDASEQTTAAIIPSGVILLWSGSIASIPSGWALCDGTGGTPDLRDRFVVGAGSSYAVGDTGGSSSVTLGIPDLPAHTHDVNNDSHSHSYDKANTPTGAPSATDTTVSGTLTTEEFSTLDHTHVISHTSTLTNSDSHDHGATTATGNGQSHENRPPYYALAYIMKT